MIYYETIKSMALYKAHEIKEVVVICEKPSFAKSEWLKIITTTGKTFYIEKEHLNDMQKYPNLYPLEERRLFAPAQIEGKKEAAPVES
jgi:hypothetical protein